MNIAKGVALGPYEILAPLGAGGMGEVWRARDRRIGRDVAVKVLPGTFREGNEQIKRFELEARAAGALNHPGLVTIFDVGTAEGSPYIVMELLEGETLRDVLGDGQAKALPVREAVDYAIQLASALAIAHEKGIWHRDLKPENIFITPDHRAKIVDFGLAKLAAEAVDGENHRTARHLTASGMVVGTPGYMSPEQVRAQPLDHRTDIFSLGVVLYEMLSGCCVFERQSAVETMHAVLSDDVPPLTDPKISPTLEAVVRHCLEKNPRDRFQSASDVAFQLRMLPELSHTRALGLQAPSWKRRVPQAAVAGVLAVLALAAGGIALFRGITGQAPRTRTFTQLTFSDGLHSFPSLAPDGKSIAYVASHAGRRHIYVQRVDGRIAIDLTSDSLADDSEPAYSPDGSQIAFRSERDGGGIFVMGALGESVRRLTDFGHNPSWSPDGQRIVVSTVGVELKPYSRAWSGELWVIDTRTGAKQPLTKPGPDRPDFGDMGDAVQPSWSPHGRRIAFWGTSWQGHRDLWTIDPDAAQPKQTVVRVTSGLALHWNPVWTPDGKYLYFGSNADGTLNLWRVAMDETTGKPTAAPEPLSLPATFSGHFSVSRDGDVAYLAVTLTNRMLAFPFDATSGATGPPQPSFGVAQEILTFQPSPDGRTVAFTTSSGGNENLFVANADGTGLRRLTNDTTKTRGVKWSPEGKTIYFYSNRDGAYHIWSIRADGSGISRVTDRADLKRYGAENIYLVDVSPDGRTLLAETDRSRFVALVHLDRPAAQRVEKLPFFMEGSTFSPDGTQVAGYVDDPVTGPGGVFVYSLRNGRREKVLDHGLMPVWLRGSRRIVAFEDGRIFVVDLETGRTTIAPFASPAGVQLDDRALPPQLSRDESTLYVRQALEQGNIWMLHHQTVSSSSGK